MGGNHEVPFPDFYLRDVILNGYLVKSFHILLITAVQCAAKRIVWNAEAPILSGIDNTHYRPLIEEAKMQWLLVW